MDPSLRHSGVHWKRASSPGEAGTSGFLWFQTLIAGSLQTGNRRVRPRLGLWHGTPLISRGLPGVHSQTKFSPGSHWLDTDSINCYPDSSWSYHSCWTILGKFIRLISSINSETNVLKQAGNPCCVQEINNRHTPDLDCMWGPWKFTHKVKKKTLRQSGKRPSSGLVQE